MAVNNYNNFIGKYETVRKILKDMYVFGCYRNTDYQKRLGISTSAYEKELKRMQFYIPPENRIKTKDKYNQIYGFSYDRFRNNENYFMNSYKLKKYTTKHMQRYISILQILSNQPETLFTLQDLLNVMGESTDIDEKGIARVINVLIQQGLVEKIEKNKRNCYKIQRNIFDGLEDEELKELYYALTFFAVKFPFRTPVFFLLETLEGYLRQKYNCMIEKKDLFIFEYNFLHTIFNDIIINDLVKAIEEEKAVEIQEYKSSFTVNTKSEKSIIYPYAILNEYWYGRQYVVGVHKQSKKAVALRLDRIREIKILKEGFEKEKYQKEVNKYEQSWCVASSWKKNQLLEIDFYYGENEAYIRKMVEEDKKWGSIEDLEVGHFIYRIQINDPREMKPWIRKFGKHAKVRGESQPEIAKELEEERQELLRNYGVISGE